LSNCIAPCWQHSRAKLESRRRLTNRWRARVRNKVLSLDRRSGGTQLNR
jgi:SNF2 family DNA or RNA helicase